MNLDIICKIKKLYSCISRIDCNIYQTFSHIIAICNFHFCYKKIYKSFYNIKTFFSFLQISSNFFNVTKQPSALLYKEKAYPHIPSVDHSHPTLTQLLYTAFFSCFFCSTHLVQPRAPLMGLTRSILFALSVPISYSMEMLFQQSFH